LSKNFLGIKQICPISRIGKIQPERGKEKFMRIRRNNEKDIFEEIDLFYVQE